MELRQLIAGVRQDVGKNILNLIVILLVFFIDLELEFLNWVEQVFVSRRGLQILTCFVELLHQFYFKYYVWI